ncbi:MAG: MFS transporter [Solobacterium sp.]|nr:MFS transporter [Solobacterium sp.]
MKKKTFYGWIIVGTCCLVMATTMGIITNCNSLFIKPVAEELGVSRQTISLMISLQSLGTMIASLFTGKIFNGRNTITVMKTAVIVMTAAYFLNSFANSILLLYVTYFINGIMLALVTTLPISFLINNWFIDRTGYALGLASMGSGFGGAFFNSLAGRIMNSAGWRTTYRLLALFILVIAVPCIFFVLKLKPEEIGEKPYREQGEKETETKQELTGYTFAQARKTPVLWILYALAVIIGICLNSMYTTVSPHLQDKGYSLVFSANVLSACLLVMAGGKIMIGRIFDRYGAKAGFFCACAALTAATVGMRFCTFAPALALIVAGVGFGCIFGAVVYPLTVPLVFGKKDYRAIIGPASALFSLGGIIGPLFAGKVYDMTGAYDLCYTIDIIVMLAVIAVILKVLPSKDQQFS